MLKIRFGLNLIMLADIYLCIIEHNKIYTLVSETNDYLGITSKCYQLEYNKYSIWFIALQPLAIQFNHIMKWSEYYYNSDNMRYIWIQ